MTTAERNRAEHPELAKVMDELREFFPEAKLLWAKNAQGKELGKRQEDRHE